MAGVLIVIGAVGLTATRDVAAQEEAGIEATVQAVVNAWNARDVGNFLARWTEQGFQAEFGFSKSDVAQLGEFIGSEPIESFTVSNVSVTGDTATADVDLFFAGGPPESNVFTFIREDGRWLIDNSEPIVPDIPAGATVVDVQLDEYQFIFDPAPIQAGDTVAFPIENIGEEAHEFVLFRITSDAPLLELLESEEEEPEGIEFMAFAEAEPGESNVAIPGGPLEAGRYGVVCFFPSPDGTPHAFLGMVSEFNVGSTGGGVSPITPPSTGSGGLLYGVDNGVPGALLAAGAALLTMGLLSLIPAARR